MSATTANWLAKIESCSEDQLHQMRDSLRDDLHKLALEKRVITEQLDRLKMDMSFIETNIASLNLKINDKEITDENFDKHRHLAITDHAVLRYMERLLGITISGIKRDIINGFPDKVPVDSTCIKTGKTVYRTVKEKDRLVIITIIKKGRR